MKKGDAQLGFPAVPYKNTKANIEALTGVPEGASAYATDTDQEGYYTGSTWVWGISAATLAALIAVTDSKNPPVGGDSVIGIDSENSSELARFTLTNIRTLYKATYDTFYAPHNGWVSYSAVVPTRTAADDPTYTIQFAGVDLTSVLSEACPIKWTQNSIVRYGWISSAPAFSGGNTTCTVLTRCNDASANYDVLDTGTFAISNFFYAPPKQPGVGFPIDDNYWTFSATNTANAHKTPPSTTVWYGGAGLTNTGPSVDAPIGAWKGTGKGILEAEDTTTTDFNCYGTVSTANNSESDTKNTFFIALTTPSGSYKIWGSIYIPFYVHPTVKTTLYMDIMTTAAADAIHIRGDVKPSRFDLVCAYL